MPPPLTASESHQFGFELVDHIMMGIDSDFDSLAEVLETGLFDDLEFWQAYADHHNLLSDDAEENELVALALKHEFLDVLERPAHHSEGLEEEHLIEIGGDSQTPSAAVLTDTLHILFPRVRVDQSTSPNTFYLLNKAKQAAGDSSDFKKHEAEYRSFGFAVIEERIQKTKAFKKFHLVGIPLDHDKIPPALAGSLTINLFKNFDISHWPFSANPMSPTPNQPWVNAPSSIVSGTAQRWYYLLQSEKDRVEKQMILAGSPANLSEYILRSSFIYLSKVDSKTEEATKAFNKMLQTFASYAVSELAKAGTLATTKSARIAAIAGDLTKALINKLTEPAKASDTNIVIRLEPRGNSAPRGLIPVNRKVAATGPDDIPSQTKQLWVDGTAKTTLARNQPAHKTYQTSAGPIRVKTQDWVRARFTLRGEMRFRIIRHFST